MIVAGFSRMCETRFYLHQQLHAHVPQEGSDLPEMKWIWKLDILVFVVIGVKKVSLCPW
jgi:hypothetical protein